MKFVQFALVLSVAVLVLGDPDPNLEKTWDEYKVHYHKVYKTPEEEARRKSIFFENKKKIDEQNKLYEQGLSTWTAGINQFTDYTAQEVSDLFTGFRFPNKTNPILSS